MSIPASIPTSPERYAATLVGCASGDTLGKSVEGWKKEQIEEHVDGGRITKPIDPVLIYDEKGNLIRQDRFGKLKYYNKDLKKGEYTDDTILTLALAESIAACKGIDFKDIARRQLYEYETRLQEDGKVSKGGFGGTTIKAFKRLLQGFDYTESGVIGGPGNAPPMKMSPLGLWMDATRNYEIGLRCAEQIGRITHLDPRSVVSGVIQAHAVYLCLQGISREDFVSSLLESCRRWEKPASEELFPKDHRETMVSRLEWIAENHDAHHSEAHAYLGSNSNVWSSYPFALFMFQKYWDEPIAGLIETVNYGGDCDTTGAMYGALCGAKSGMIFPQEWLGVLQGKERLIAAAKWIYGLKKF